MSMFIGMHCGPFKNESLDQIAEFAEGAGIKGLEVIVGQKGGQVDVDRILSGDTSEVKKILDRHDVVITCLAFYSSSVISDKSDQDFFRKSIEACSILDLDVLCCTAGRPMPGQKKKEILRTDFREIYSELADHAKDHGVKLAMENWFATLLQGMDNLDLAFEMIPHDNFGLNFDPSHLVHQQIDYIEAVHHFADRIFHTHAKDTQINYRRMHYSGIYEKGWWRYRIPGRGEINWNAFVSALKEVGYDSVLSIEHEDGLFGREQGFIHGARYLNSIIW